jgi:type VI secretion system protein ImpB
MAKEGSVAPKERVNIVYKPATGGMQEQVELPFKTLVLGDFTLEKDETPLEDRDPVSVDKDNFNEVLAGQKVKLETSVPDKLTEGAGEDDLIPVNLKFNGIRDFDPDQVIQQIPQLKNLHDLREALKALKGPMGNIPQFRKKVQELVADDEARDKLIEELKLDEGAEAE